MDVVCGSSRRLLPLLAFLVKNPGDYDEVWDFVFDNLAEAVCCLGCIGPPICKLSCKPGPKYDTSFCSYRQVIELEIDGHKYEIKMRKIPPLELLADQAEESN